MQPSSSIVLSDVRKHLLFALLQESKEQHCREAAQRERFEHQDDTAEHADRSGRAARSAFTARSASTESESSRR